MTKNAPLLRPAASAIAAFLVLSTPAAFAQEMTTVPMTPPVSVPTTTAPPTVQPPATTAPATAPAAQPAPQPVIRVPTDLPPVPQAAPERQAAAAPRARAERPAPRQRATAPSPAARAEIPAEPAAAPITAAEDVLPVTPPVASTDAPVVDAAPAAAQVEKASASGDAFPWEIVGGAAALLIAGGAGLAFARRRRASSEVWEFDENSNAEWVPGAEPTAEPAFTREAVAATPELASEPAAPAATAPAFVAAPAGSMGRHEALAMAGPTPDNPFTTLSKRLARARFLDRQERADYDAALATSEPQADAAPARKPVSAWEIAQRQPAPAPAEQEVRRLQTGSVRKDLKPGWTRN